jgi:acyl-CoA synthetase (AMP-forming)/AMP-acid ligase II
VLPDGTVARTISTLGDQASRWADRLAGAGCVGLHLRNRVEWPEIFLGAWRAGCRVVLLDAALTVDRVARISGSLGIGCLVTEGPDGRVTVQPGPGGVGLPAGDLIKLTSGTTGEPRALLFTAGQLLADGDAICATMGLRESDRNFGVISFAHSYGFSNLITPLLARGIAVVVSDDALPRALAAGLQASAATVLPAVPAHFRALSALPGAPAALRLCLSAGAPLGVAVAAAFAERWGRKIHSFYGASECGGICYDATDEPVTAEGFVGEPLQGVRLSSLAGEEGRFRVESAAVALGYFPAGADDPVRDGAFYPPDLLRRTAAGFCLAGRVSDWINVAGRKVNPVEIENVLRACPGVTDVVVLGLPDGLRGEEVAACVTGGATEATLRAEAGRRLPAWQVPRRWIFLAEIPVNARGKTSRSALRESLLARAGG